MRLCLLLISCVSLLLSFGASAQDSGSNGGTVIYGISASQFAAGSGVKPLEAVEERLGEIHKLGANVLWLQPVFQTASKGPEQGYDVTDYMKLNPSFGTEKDLKNLVKQAHELGMRVILDVPLNHTDIQAPFAQDVIAKGKASKYYSFYQHQPWGKNAYSRFLHLRKDGKGDFSYYFWNELVNLNYDNPNVRKYSVHVLEHWMKKDDVDGYRLDASWGPEARWPGFYPAVARDLRSIKPHAFLLAEDKAGTFPKLPGKTFDAAYDWNTTDPNWVSKWSFQTGGNSGSTVFNEKNPVQAAKDFVAGVGSSAHSPIGVLRYTEDNDTPSFNSSHSPEQTRFATEAMFLLPGVPLIFYGQEVGAKHALYDLPAFSPSKPIRDQNPKEWDFYQKLIALRKNSRALSEGSIEDLQAHPDGTVTFIREYGSESLRIKLDFTNDTVTINSQPIDSLLTPSVDPLAAEKALKLLNAPSGCALTP